MHRAALNESVVLGKTSIGEEIETGKHIYSIEGGAIQSTSLTRGGAVDWHQYRSWRQVPPIAQYREIHTHRFGTNFSAQDIENINGSAAVSRGRFEGAYVLSIKGERGILRYYKAGSLTGSREHLSANIDDFTSVVGEVSLK